MKQPETSDGLDDRCGGKTKAGTPCKKEPGWGTSHVGVGCCKLHGGSTPTQVAHGQLVLAQQAATALAVPIATNPFQSLLQLEAKQRGLEEHLWQRVLALDPDMVWVRPISKLRRPLKEEKGEENPSIEVVEITEAPLDLNIAIKAWRLAAEDLRKTSKTVIAGGIAERQAKVLERDARAFEAAQIGILEDCGVKVDARVLGFVRQRLTAIDSTAVEEA